MKGSWQDWLLYKSACDHQPQPSRWVGLKSLVGSRPPWECAEQALAPLLLELRGRRALQAGAVEASWPSGVQAGQGGLVLSLVFCLGASGSPGRKVGSETTHLSPDAGPFVPG